MASLKEIKDRINTVKGTLKITSAMKMVATSKLRKAQEAVGNLVPYQRQMHHILSDLLSDGSVTVGEAYMEERPLKKVAILAFSSNSSLCGAFNSNVIRHFTQVLEKYYASGLTKSDIIVMPVGRKMADAVKKLGIYPDHDFNNLADKPSYEAAVDLAGQLTDMFLNHEVDKIELVYSHSKSTSSQVPVNETYLPVSMDSSLHSETEEHHGFDDFIIEPDAATVLRELLPKVLCLKIYAVLLDANAAEHAARMIAMQLATDNGNQLLEEIRIQYNKQRQQEITNELQDIIGGSLA